MHSSMGECQQQKHTQHAPAMKTECDYLYGWIKMVTYTKISPKMVNPRDITGNTEEEEEQTGQGCPTNSINVGQAEH